MAAGTCYFPDCPQLVLSETEGHYISAVEIAHIHGANPGSQRFDPSLTARERAHLSNLILLCPVHHKLVDRLEPEKYPPQVLKSWKEKNEGSDALMGNAEAIGADDLLAALEEIGEKLGPQRHVSVELTWGLMVNDFQVLTSDLPARDSILASNPQLNAQSEVLVAVSRNSGTHPVDIEAINFHYLLNREGTLSAALLGRNDMGWRNPRLPYRLLDGASISWFMQVQTVRYVYDQILCDTSMTK